MKLICLGLKTENIITIMYKFKQKTYSEGDKKVFIDFICKLEGYKTRCKNLHWAAPKKNIHVYLDEFLDVISDYQDGLAEGYMGILGKMGPLDINGIGCNASNAMIFIEEVIEETKKFYGLIPEGTEFKGITSEAETFIQNCQKYHYLFGLCEVQ